MFLSSQSLLKTRLNRRLDLQKLQEDKEDMKRLLRRIDELGKLLEDLTTHGDAFPESLKDALRRLDQYVTSALE